MDAVFCCCFIDYRLSIFDSFDGLIVGGMLIVLGSLLLDADAPSDGDGDGDDGDDYLKRI